MADDLDAELLALAGDDSDEGETKSPPQKEEKTGSASPHSPHQSSTMARKGTARAVKRNRQSKKSDAKDFIDDDDMFV